MEPLVTSSSHLQTSTVSALPPVPAVPGHPPAAPIIPPTAMTSSTEPASNSSTKVPPFGRQSYWEERYTQRPDTYEWLNYASILDADLDRALASCASPAPQILHIGCGNSALSFGLRLKVRDPGQITNCDYSGAVVRWGRGREREMFGARWSEDGDSGGEGEGEKEEGEKEEEEEAWEMPMMRWAETDLLELQAVISSFALAAFDVVLDKSTVDSVACTSTREASLPYFLYADAGETEAGPETTGTAVDLQRTWTGYVNAVQLLAVHLALVTKPGGRWIAYSYSSTRFWFLDPEWRSSPEEEEAGPLPLHEEVPHPNQLWRMISARAVARPYGEDEGPRETTTTDAGNTHFLYVMERTGTPLKVKNVV